MKRIFLAVICIVMLTSTVATADQAGEKKAVLKMLEITNARNMSVQIMKSMEAMMDRQFQTETVKLSPKGQEALMAIRKDTVKWLQENFSWDQMKDMYVDIYTQVFTEDEINQLVQFYQSPLGKKMLAKMPELIRLTFEKSQALVQKKMPLFQEKLQKSLSNLEAKYGNKTAQNQMDPESPENQQK